MAAGYNILILSDRGADRDRAPIPSLLATAGVHHHLVREGTRTRCGLVVESGDAREVHHCALLLGYGAGVVNPYLAFETLDDMIRQGLLRGITHEKAVKNYIKALNKGILKVMSKMGISTLPELLRRADLRGGRPRQPFVDKYFTWTASRIGGVGIEVVAEEVLERHRRAFDGRGQHRALSGAASISGGATASTTCSTPRRSSSCSTPREAASTRSSRSTRGSSTIRASGSRRCAACSS